MSYQRRYVRVIEQPGGSLFGWLFSDYDTLQEARSAALNYYLYPSNQPKPTYVIDKLEGRAWRLLGGAFFEWHLPLQRELERDDSPS